MVVGENEPARGYKRAGSSTGDFHRGLLQMTQPFFRDEKTMSQIGEVTPHNQGAHPVGGWVSTRLWDGRSWGAGGTVSG